MMNKRHLWFALAFLVLLITIWNLYIVISEYRKYEEQKESFSRTRALIEFSRSVADFVHESQKERGMSAAYLGEGKADHFARRLESQRQLSDEKFAVLIRRVDKLRHYELDDAFEHSVNAALRKKEELRFIRKRVMSHTITAPDEIDFYTSLNADFLGLIPLAAKAAPTREIALRLYDLATALDCKEKAGIERATLSNVFAAGRFESQMFERSVAIHGVQQECMNTLEIRASAIEREIYDAIVVQDPFKRSQTLYDEAIRGDFMVGPVVWFDTMTAKIDLLGQMTDEFSRFLITDLGHLERKTLRQHWIFLVGTLLFGLVMLISTVVILRKLAKMITDLRISAAVFNSHEAVIVTDSHGDIIRVNTAFEIITGYTQAEVIGKTPALLKSGKQDGYFYRQMWESLTTAGEWSGEIINRRKSGELYPEWLSITAVWGEEGEITHYIAIFSDITLKKQTEEHINRLAFYDPLTQLPNRRLFIDRLILAQARSERDRSYGMLAFIDLDNFKIVNDTKGHIVGDVLLVEAARRLEGVIRSEDTVARLGGDEFVIMAEELGDTLEAAMAHATAVAEKIIEVLRSPFELSGESFYVSGSVGIALFYDHAQNVNDILAQADTAMYSAKQAGRSTYRFFDTELQDILLKRIELEHALYRAVEEKEFELFYQLQYEKEGSVYGAEALIRWHHPEKGMISPAEFIPVAEESSLIVSIGEWVICEACDTLRKWSTDPLFKNVVVSVNVSTRHFLSDSFVPFVLGTVERYGISPSRLRLELTESLLIDDITAVHAIMSTLRSFGITFSLDDFGTGYSSLSYLKEFEFHEIKIDRSFVRDMQNDSSDLALIRAIVAMGEALELEVIAEGVETEEQYTLLKRMGCHRFQGYWFARPMPRDEVVTLVSTKGAF